MKNLIIFTAIFLSTQLLASDPITIKAQRIQNGSAIITLPVVTGSLISSGDLGTLLPPQSGNAGKFLYTDGSAASWQVTSGSGGLILSGSTGSPIVASAGTPIPILSQQRQLIFVSTASGAVTISASPRITAGSSAGQEIIMVGTSDANYPVLNNGNGLSLNGTISLMNKRAVYLVWDGSVWFEVSRQ